MHKISGKQALLDAALRIIRIKGYTATTVEDLCEQAKVSKGAFFHHYKSKEELAIAAAEYWSTLTHHLFEQAPYHKHLDPLDRLLGYIDFRMQIIRGEIPEFTCLVGTMVQEIYDSNPKIRTACERSILGHAAEVANDVVEAKKKYVPHASWNAESVATFTQAAIQGAYIVSKAKNDPQAAIDCISHLRRYIESLFTPAKKGKK